MPDEFKEGEGADNLQIPPPFFPYSGDRLPDDSPSKEPIQVKVDGLYGAESKEGSYRFVVLSDGYRQLKISIGPFEALAIVQVLEERRPERPLTHDLMRNIIFRDDGTMRKYTKLLSIAFWIGGLFILWLVVP